MSYLPWQQDQWRQMTSLINGGQLTHGWLFYAPAGTGSTDFVQALSQYLLCEQPDSSNACGQCPSCQWFAAETHPDRLLIRPEAEGKAIKVDQIRDLIDKLSLAPHGQRGQRVVIISPAEAMNRQAANSLLKSLEEPQANSYFFLLASDLSALSATIRSRCQLLKLSAPDSGQASDWLRQQLDEGEDNKLALEVTNNAPLAALDLLESGAIPVYRQLFSAFVCAASQPRSAIDLAELWLKQEQYMPINWILRWLSVLIKLKQSGAAVTAPYDEQGTRTLLQAVNLTQLFRFYDETLEASRLWSAPLNRRLQLEGLFSKWLALFK